MYVLLRNTNLELGTLDVDRSLITTIVVQTGYCEIIIHQDLSGFFTTNSFPKGWTTFNMSRCGWMKDHNLMKETLIRVLYQYQAANDTVVVVRVSPK